MPEKNRFSLLLSLGAAVLIVSGGIAFYWLLWQRSRFPGDTLLTAQLIPQDALVVASISTDAAQWQQLQQYGTPETKVALDKNFKQLQEELIKANDYNYPEDIEPWLGETVMVAYLPDVAPEVKAGKIVLPQKQKTFLPDLIVVPIEDPSQAQQLLAKAKSQKAKSGQERTYKGIKIIEFSNSDSQNYSATMLENFLVVTNHPQIMERVINTYKGKPSVAATPDYQEKFNQIKVSKPFAQIYWNMPALSKAAATNSQREFSPQNLLAGRQRQGIVTKVSLESEGMRWRSISWLQPESTQKYRLENRNSSLSKFLPANTLSVLSGGNLAQLWQDYTAGADTNPLLPRQLTNLNAGLKATLGLDLEQDLLPWTKGEFSLALIPALQETIATEDNQLSPPLGAGVVLMVKTSDRSVAEATFEKLDQVIANRYEFSVEPTELDGQPVVNWTSPLGGITVTHGWLENDLAFLTLGAPIVETIIPQPQGILTQAPLFQRTVPTNPKPNNGQFFLDVERTINSGKLNLPKLTPPQQIWVKAIGAIGLTVAISDERTTKFELFVKLKKNHQTDATPKPKPSESLSP
ncbi:MAG: DUF3352 domain-containing protein [Symploca sp. SIO1C4]|uniref:DUF3352 domain-containing protein n=1 Tax=Symploca sp. SIO1C4 TaxID=2607765 RepID=A0A6B3NDY2_9CYAN|nr:DUF3352 domain-containing protein [Symploca sp. SIO1C4]NET07688.1 DUF3352 domain-containing protein [Symploca sp. SIO2B6]